MDTVIRFRHILSRLLEPARRKAEYFERRRLIFALAAIVSFPVYYFVWHDLFPQPYENLPLRLLGSALFLPIVLAHFWPGRYRKALSAYYYAAIFYALPFFFPFMLFKNNGAEVWVESTLVALFIMIMLLDWLSLIIYSVFGTTFAWLAYRLTTDSSHVQLVELEHLPIIVFALVMGAIANYIAEAIRVEQERAMLATAGSIAHELHTPLLGIKSGAAGLRKYLPALISGYFLARDNKLPVTPIRNIHLEAMQGVLERIESEADHSNAIIDILLANTTHLSRIKNDDRKTCSLVHCVNKALARYPFSGQERDLVHWNPGRDIVFHGSELLVVHVLFNLMKNALRHIALAGKGEIFVFLDHTPPGGKLIFRDTSSGIPPEMLPHIFKRFYSSSIHDVLGSGIGLAFCQDVMRAIDGAIECSSVEGQYTEFVLTFPEPI